MNHDALFKQLLTTPSVLQGFFEGFLPAVAQFVDFESLHFIDKEHTTVYGRPRTGDLLVRTRFRGEPAEFLIHLEHQAQKSSDLIQRMLEYFALDWRDSGLPVYPILVVGEREVVLDAALPIVMDFPNKRVLQFDFDVINLPRMKAASYIRMPNAAALALAARMDFGGVDRLTVIKDFLSTMLRASLVKAVSDVVAGYFFAYRPLSAREALQVSEEFAKVESMEMRNRIMELTNPWIEAGRLQGIQTGIQQGIQTGIQQGLQTGIQQGIRKGEADLVLRQLGRRFGFLPDSEAESIRCLPREKIEELAEALLEFTSRDDLAAWLRRYAR